MTERPRAFISYAREDGEAFATALRQRLEREEPEITLWQDRARMQGGIGWWKQITDALDIVQFLVLVMSPAAIRSPMAGKEWRYARQQGVCVYPVKAVPDAALSYEGLPRWMTQPVRTAWTVSSPWRRETTAAPGPVGAAIRRGRAQAARVATPSEQPGTESQPDAQDGCDHGRSSSYRRWDEDARKGSLDKRPGVSTP